MNESLSRPSLKVLGNSTSSGGTFGNVRVTGECKFLGDVDCLSLHLTGEIEVTGTLTAGQLKTTGECEVAGRIQAKSLRGQGQIHARQNIAVEDVKYSGGIMVQGDCEAETLQLNGALEVGGLLNAGRIELTLFGPGKAAEVGGGTIIIKPSKTKSLVPKLAKDLIFTANQIEGDIVELQNTKAQRVRGGSVTIGAGCEIGTVEYRNNLDIHKNATVLRQIKI
ncbi:hypothetical protein [Paenibacillus sp. NFR01]|uniref:hypothetical protein n=1 Tax=Paenibacillus sp. NFR01 TaxID=1566279 RepID=UPI0008C6AD34|nr:hypothetical protein [Paenibacillus sp. NFR01]SET46673.1 hypothetical protein SAMN03159358_1766 [Paenibacillus sp. NFR01]